MVLAVRSAGELVWDNHVCLPMDFAKAERSLPNLVRCRAGGVDVVSINVGYGAYSIEHHLQFVAFLRDRIRSLGGGYVLIETVADIERAKAQEALAICFDIEGAAPVAGDLGLIERFYRLGVRWMLVAYNQPNAFGGGCHEDDPGLTARGREWVAEMNRVGMVACCSHTGYRTARDVIERSADPVIFSHSNPRALEDHPRNVPDDLIQACARRGGVVGINGVSLFLGGSGATPARVAEHIDYVAQLVGVEHVGIGTDFVFDVGDLGAEVAAAADTFPAGWGYDQPIEFLAPEELPHVAAALAHRGYTRGDVAAVMGGNLMRIARTVWKSPT